MTGLIAAQTLTVRTLVLSGRLRYSGQRDRTGAICKELLLN